MNVRCRIILIFLLIIPHRAGWAGPTETIRIAAEDGLPIVADLYVAHESSSTPFIVLFHQAGSSRGEYREIAPRLNEFGFNCLAVDLRSGRGINDVRNETARAAKNLNKGARYIDALPDVRAALVHAREVYAEGKLLAWGSSYSASLVIHLAGEMPQLVDGVLAFAPGEYFVKEGKPDDWIEQSAKGIKVPAFLTSARNERDSVQPIYEAIPGARKTYYLPSTAGNHGSRALWRRYSDNDGYWAALTDFFSQYFTAQPK